jgi:hypothetical protein
MKQVPSKNNGWWYWGRISYFDQKIDEEKNDKSQTKLDLEQELSKIKDNLKTMKEVTNLLEKINNN